MAKIILEFERTLYNNFLNKYETIPFVMLDDDGVLVVVSTDPAHISGDKMTRTNHPDCPPELTIDCSPTTNWFEEGSESLFQWCNFLEDINLTGFVIRDMEMMSKLKYFIKESDFECIYSAIEDTPKGFARFVKLVTERLMD